MENFKKLLPRVLLLSFVIKMLAVSPGLADAAIMFSLGAVVVFQVYLENTREIEQLVEAYEANSDAQDEMVNKKIDAQNSTINKQNEVIQVSAVELAKMKSIVEGLKIKNDFTNGTSAFNKRTG